MRESSRLHALAALTPKDIIPRRPLDGWLSGATAGLGVVVEKESCAPPPRTFVNQLKPNRCTD